MKLTHRIARQFRQFYSEGSPTGSYLKQHVADLSYEQAVAELPGFNSILKLVYHIYYYLAAQLRFLRGEPLDAHDKYSFDHPPIRSQAEWEAFLEKVFADAEEFARRIEQMPEEMLWSTFVKEKYGDWYGNFHVNIEHSYYHLGQIVLLKKLLAQRPQT